MDNKEFDDAIYRGVKKQVKIMKAFYMHLVVYVLVILMLMVINLATDATYFWFLWPAFGWGITIALQGISVFNLAPFLGHDWEQRKIQELIKKEKGVKWQ